jgi:dihydrolipoamide dehydrogenase
MSNNHYDAIVIGAGPGGYPCAIRLAQLGKKTLIVDKANWGGVCLNVGCIPSKAMISAAKRYKAVTTAGEFGIRIEGPVNADMAGIQKFKNGVVDKLTSGISQLLKANGVDMLQGSALLTGPTSLTVQTEKGHALLTADNIVLATGSRPIEIPGFSFDHPDVICSTGALALTEIPDRMVVIGGGVIGLELGSVYAKLGCAVTVVEMTDSLLPGVDKAATKIVARKAKKDGIVMMTSARALGYEAVDDGLALKIETKKGEVSLTVDKIFVAVGRRPNTENLGLEEVGVALDGPFIGTDAAMRTNVPSIFAIGDVVGQPMLAHKATYEAEVVAEVIAGHDVVFDALTVPSVIFTDPEVAIAGLSEEQAKKRGEIKVGKVPYAAIGRSLTTGEPDGFIKVIIDSGDHAILGVTVVGANASDLISEAVLAIEMGCTAQDIGLTIHPHPTFGEGVMEAAKAALGEAVHVLNK